MRHIGEPEAIGATVAAKTSLAALGDLQEAERFKLAQGRGNAFLVHAVVDKLKLCNDQASALGAGLRCSISSSVEYQARCQTEDFSTAPNEASRSNVHSMRQKWPDCAGGRSSGDSKLKVPKIGEAHLHATVHIDAGNGAADEGVNDAMPRDSWPSRSASRNPIRSEVARRRRSVVMDR